MGLYDSISEFVQHLHPDKGKKDRRMPIQKIDSYLGILIKEPAIMMCLVGNSDGLVISQKKKILNEDEDEDITAALGSLIFDISVRLSNEMRLKRLNLIILAAFQGVIIINEIIENYYLFILINTNENVTRYIRMAREFSPCLAEAINEGIEFEEDPERKDSMEIFLEKGWEERIYDLKN